MSVASTERTLQDAGGPPVGRGFATVVDEVLRRASEQPAARALTFLASDGGVREALTRAELAQRVQSAAAHLQQQTAAGDRVLLVQPPGVDYVVSFLACVAAGTVAVTSHPRVLAHGGRALDALLEDSAARVVLTGGEATTAVERGGARRTVAPVTWLDVRGCTADPDAWRPAPTTADDLALLQYTSGTTRSPRGVMVRHGGLVHNTRVLRRRLGTDATDVAVGWLPPFHDMGLVAGIVEPLVSGCHTVLMAPATFAARPLRWLEAVTRYRGTYAYAPTFALDLCVEQVREEDRAALDLSSWRSLTVGAEPLRARSLARFRQAFAAHGLAAGAVGGGYGLAESTLAVVADPVGAPVGQVRVDGAALDDGRVVPAGDEGVARTLVVSGRSLDPAQQVLVVDPQTHSVLPSDRVGEIWLAGPSVAAGYWGHPELTEATFGARTSDGAGPYLRTGDLGFLVEGGPGGEPGVVVCGRRKDLVIVRGRNLYPQDVELAAAQSHAAVRAHLCAASSLTTDDEEGLLVVAEVPRTDDRDELDAISDAVRAGVLADTEVEPAAVVLVRPAGLPRTTSGKVQRGACAQRFRDGTLPEQRRWVAPRPAPGPAVGPAVGPTRPMAALLAGLPVTLRVDVVVADLLRHVAGVTGRPVGTDARHRTLPALGVDSLRSLAVQREVAQGYGAPLGGTDMLDLTVELLAQRVVAACGEPVVSAAPTPVPVPARDAPEFVLTDVQEAYVVGRGAGLQLGGVGAHWYAEVDTQDLDPVRLVRAFDEVVARHPMLRAVVTPDSRQRVLDHVPAFPVRHHDVSGADAATRDAHLADVRERLAHVVHDPTAWPLLDLEITDLGAGRRRVHLGVDLVVADARSIGVLLRDWRACYEGRGAELPTPRTTFRDAVQALVDRAAGPEGAAAERYWQDRLPTLPLGPDLPWVPLPAGQPPRFTRVEHRLAPEAWDRLRARAAERGLTPASVLLTSWAAAVGTWSRTPRFHLTVTVADLPDVPGVRDVVGDLTGVDLLDVDLTDAPAFGDLGAALQRRLRQDLEHGALSGVEVLRRLRRRDGTRAAAPGVVFTCALGRGDGDDLPTAWLGDEVQAVSQTPQVALDHQVFERDGALHLTWDVVEDALPPGVARAVAAACAALVDRLAGVDGAAWLAPARSTDGEHLARVGAANATVAPLRVDVLHAALVERAREDAAAPAVLTATRSLTRGALVVGAGGVAARLADLGAGPGTRVAVLASKSPEQVVAVVAVLLAGAAYVPVDPALPVARQEHLLRHADVAAVLVGPGGDPALAHRCGVPAVVVDVDGAATDAAAVDAALAAAPGPARPDDLAYIVYTSGSTGEPKGVAVRHGAAHNTCLDVADRYQVGRTDRVLGLSSMSFDLSVWDVFGVLGAGGALVLPAPQDRRDPAQWERLMVAHGVTLWNSVPALMQMLLEHRAGRDDAVPLPLRVVLLSGDWIPVDLPDRLRDQVPSARLVSLGGATEGAVWSVAHDVDEPAPGWDSVPYGRALRNQRIHVLDHRLRECPEWVTGEIHLAGAGLADGYWRDPERTAASFVTHPTTGERLYRTGDLGRWRPGAVVEFLGREDGQVKVGGHRVELGEVEAALVRHPEVGSAAVVAVGPREQRRLVAHVVPLAADALPDGGRALAAAVRAYASQVLAAALVPSAVVVRPTLPLTANGKVDRTALAQAVAEPAPPDRRSGSPDGTDRADPGSTVAMLRDLVGRELPGVHVDPDAQLFELGVDSVGLVRLHRRLRNATGREVPLTAFFEHPTIRTLAAHLDAAVDPASDRAPDPAADTAADRAPRRARRRTTAATRPDAPAPLPTPVPSPHHDDLEQQP
ncbi:MAG: amino acid adenylation domain-containing protein [Cellulomonas sp.]|uniref:non-ribosomal peptide synthetase n=1 Tax=Cellulomonas sp. TaxID=40001 RepID=UPI0019E9CF3F|nr:non-ribosomal peptide synthetase [Cellulomonas sp.]MBF0688236.1 amino acid adenylation domain-containing protein [Cellulomonas sp.]